MPKSRGLLLEQLPEIFVSNKQLTTLIYRELQRGRLRKLASRLYTRNMQDDPAVIIKRNIWQLIAKYFPGALIADRTALEYKPAADGTVFVISTKKRAICLPGLRIQPRKGIGPLESDKPFIDGLFLSSEARAFLENMHPSRVRSTKISRTLSRKELEEKLDLLLRRSGEQALQKLRHAIHPLASKLKLEKEAHHLDALIGTLLGTREEKLISDRGFMRQAGKPYDPERWILFQTLFEALSSIAPIVRFAMQLTPTAEINLAFFEAYFSNFIEGTKFAVDEAEAIIFEGKIPYDVLSLRSASIHRWQWTLGTHHDECRISRYQ